MIVGALQQPTKKKSYKAEKYEREKAKRVAKREVKHWADVRARPHLYRPDGTLITLQERGIPKEEIKAVRQVRKVERAQVVAEKGRGESSKIKSRLSDESQGS